MAPTNSCMIFTRGKRFVLAMLAEETEASFHLPCSALLTKVRRQVRLLGRERPDTVPFPSSVGTSSLMVSEIARF